MILSLVRNAGGIEEDMKADSMMSIVRPTIGFLKVNIIFSLHILATHHASQFLRDVSSLLIGLMVTNSACFNDICIDRHKFSGFISRAGGFIYPGKCAYLIIEKSDVGFCDRGTRSTTTRRSCISYCLPPTPRKCRVCFRTRQATTNSP